MPMSNTPVTNVGSADIRCNAGTKPVSGACAVKPGSTVTIEMHQQPGDRSCKSEAIGGAHYGPVMAYMTKVSDAATADGSTGWFKVFSNSWAAKSGAGSGDDDYWGTKDLNTCCGKMDVKIPADIPNGDYLLRAEAIALHTAGSANGAQFYMTCYQIRVSGGSGSASPPTVKFPGAYAANNPGILVNIHAAMSTYVAPGPTVYAGGSVETPGGQCSNCAATCTAGKGAVGTALALTPTAAATVPDANGSSGSGASSGSSGSSGGSSGSAACAQAAFQQCGGNGYSGCTSCAAGLTCKAVSPPYYSQCQ